MTPGRADLPQVFAWVKDLRDAFGPEISALVKGGLDGVPVFYASENGRQVGTPLPAPRVEISAADMVITPTEKDSHATRR